MGLDITGLGVKRAQRLPHSVRNPAREWGEMVYYSRSVWPLQLQMAALYRRKCRSKRLFVGIAVRVVERDLRAISRGWVGNHEDLEDFCAAIRAAIGKGQAVYVISSW